MMTRPVVERSSDKRLRVLDATQLLDSKAEAAFDRLTRLAAHLLEAPVALVSLVDTHRQFFKSAVGLADPWATRRETPLTHSFCQHVTGDRARLVVADAREHPRLRENLAIRDLGVVAYAGIPLIVDGEAIGSFCVIDARRRDWAPEKLQLLEDLAGSVTSEIELRLALRSAESHRALTSAIVESLGDACMAAGTDGNFIVVNEAARRIFDSAEPGLPIPADWAGLHRSRRLDGSPMPSSEGALGRGLRGESTNGLTFTLQRPGAAEPIWVETTGRPVRDGAGNVIAAVAVYHDVTAKRKELADAERSAQIYRAIVQHLPRGAVFMVDRDYRYVSADGPILPEIMRRTDLPTIVGRKVEDVVLPANLAGIMETYARTFAGEASGRDVERAGSYFETSTVPIYEGGVVTNILVFSFDITERRAEAAALREARDGLAREQALLESTLSHIEDGVALLDDQATILLCNEPFAAIIGMRREDVRGMPRGQFLERLVPMLEAPENFRADFSRNLSAAAQHEYTFARPRRRILRRSWLPVELAQGNGYLVTWHDVTAERDLLREREQQLLVDALTGIPNRRAAEVAMRTERERSKRTGTPLCVAIFDVDHFKQVNDRYGHGTGDEVLKCVGAALAGQARLTDMVARWGGEEFVAVLNVPLDGARVFCERARAAVEALACPPVERITISVGVAELQADESLADALTRADERLYEAKRSGRNRVAG